METTPARAKYKVLTAEERHAIVMELLRTSTDGKLQHGSMNSAASRWSCSVQTVYRLWKAYKKAKDTPNAAFALKKKNRCGAKPPSATMIANLYCKLKVLKLEERGDLRSISAGIGIPKSTLHRYVKNGILRVHTAALKPSLTDEHKKARLDFVLSFLHHRAEGHQFDDMHNHVHVDEKWFYLKKTKRRVYLVPDEQNPHISTQHKSHIPKLMFLCAVARPRVNPATGEWFDGRIGLWPFAKYVHAVRSSRNRPAGTLELKPYNVDHASYRDMMISHVIPAIKRVWPGDRTVFVQQDNARSHIPPSDRAFADVAAQDGWNIVLTCQPA